MRRAKEKWFKRRAEEAERERFDEKRFWQNIRELQCARQGRVPARVVTIQDEAGPMKPPMKSMSAGGGTFIWCSTSKPNVASLNWRE